LNSISVLLVVLSVLLQLFGYYALAHRVEPFMYQFYLFSWWSCIMFVDAVLARKTRRFHIFNRQFVPLALMSVAFWCLFELVNLRLQNWFYINVPGHPALRLTGYMLAFATVIPAISLFTTLYTRVLPDIRIKPVRIGDRARYLPPLGLLCLVLALLFPTYCFALAWVFLAFVVDGCNYRRGYPSFLADLEKGSLTPMLAAGLSGMTCGVFWEFWNFWAVTKWVYTVPFFERTKLFEMPLPGYLGFAFFALETMAFVHLLREGRFLTRARWWASAAAVAFSLLSFALIDRYTVFSRLAGVEELPFLTRATRAAVAATGAKTTYTIDPRLLTMRERKALALLELKGLGLDNWIRLNRYGISTVQQLADCSQEQLSAMIDEQNMRRVRVYLRAAQKQLRQECP
jgi:predicted flap endonuclease-1-like 5' DNA nuclease